MTGSALPVFTLATVADPPGTERTLGDLLEMKMSDLSKVDIAEMQLLCIGELENTGGARVSRSLEILDQATQILRVQPLPSGTIPDSRKKAGALLDVIYEIRGSLGPLPLPIAYISLGRRLGYPIKLVASEDGLTVRWEGDSESFAVCDARKFPSFANGAGVERMGELAPEIDAGKEEQNRDFTILEPADEFSILLASRGAWLVHQGRDAEALVAYAQAHVWSPDCRDHLAAIANVTRRVTPCYGHTSPMSAPDYSDRPDPLAEVQEINDRLMRQRNLDLAENQERTAVYRKYQSDHREMLRRIGEITTKYSKIRAEAIKHDNEKLMQDELERQGLLKRQSRRASNP